jgi:acetoin utilization deacetylase AcuC-like enzyme
MSESTLKVIYSDAFLTDYPTASCENPSRVQAIMHALSKRYEVIEAQPASKEDVLLVHADHIFTSVSKSSDLFPAALKAAGGAIQAADLAMEGQPTFAAVRPPGHHASPSSHWGFCFFNNVAISLEKLLQTGRISTALVLDIDLHFGDGTDNFFAHRKNVVVANIQENNRKRFLEETDLALTSNEYDIVAISAGFDRHVEDWGGTLTTEDYFTIGRNVRDYAQVKCNGRYFAVLEGGYNTQVLGENALALCRGMDPSE